MKWTWIVVVGWFCQLSALAAPPKNYDDWAWQAGDNYRSAKSRLESDYFTQADKVRTLLRSATSTYETDKFNVADAIRSEKSRYENSRYTFEDKINSSSKRLGRALASSNDPQARALARKAHVKQVEAVQKEMDQAETDHHAKLRELEGKLPGIEARYQEAKKRLNGWEEELSAIKRNLEAAIEGERTKRIASARNGIYILGEYNWRFPSPDFGKPVGAKDGKTPAAEVAEVAETEYDIPQGRGWRSVFEGEGRTVGAGGQTFSKDVTHFRYLDSGEVETYIPKAKRAAAAKKEVEATYAAWNRSVETDIKDLRERHVASGRSALNAWVKEAQAILDKVSPRVARKLKEEIQQEQKLREQALATVDQRISAHETYRTEFLAAEKSRRLQEIEKLSSFDAAAAKKAFSEYSSVVAKFSEETIPALLAAEEERRKLLTSIKDRSEQLVAWGKSAEDWRQEVEKGLQRSLEEKRQARVKSGATIDAWQQKELELVAGLKHADLETELKRLVSEEYQRRLNALRPSTSDLEARAEKVISFLTEEVDRRFAEMVMGEKPSEVRYQKFEAELAEMDRQHRSAAEREEARVQRYPGVKLLSEQGRWSVERRVSVANWYSQAQAKLAEHRAQAGKWLEVETTAAKEIKELRLIASTKRYLTAESLRRKKEFDRLEGVIKVRQSERSTQDETEIRSRYQAVWDNHAEDIVACQARVADYDRARGEQDRAWEADLSQVVKANEAAAGALAFAATERSRYPLLLKGERALACGELRLGWDLEGQLCGFRLDAETWQSQFCISNPRGVDCADKTLVVSADRLYPRPTWRLTEDQAKAVSEPRTASIVAIIVDGRFERVVEQEASSFRFGKVRAAVNPKGVFHIWGTSSTGTPISDYALQLRTDNGELDPVVDMELPADAGDLLVPLE